MDVMAKIWHGQFLSGAKFVETPDPRMAPTSLFKPILMAILTAYARFAHRQTKIDGHRPDSCNMLQQPAMDS